MSEPSPLWCANDEPHEAHTRHNRFAGVDWCSGRPEPDPPREPTWQQEAEWWKEEYRLLAQKVSALAYSSIAGHPASPMQMREIRKRLEKRVDNPDAEL